MTVMGLGSVLLTAPATAIERFIPVDWPVRLTGCSGWILHSGTCHLTLRTHHGWQSAGEVSFGWHLDSSAAVILTLVHNGRPAGSIHPSLGKWVATDIEFQFGFLPTSVLPKQIVDGWQPEGRATFRIPSFSCKWPRSSCHGGIHAELRDLRSAAAGSAQFGTYLLELEIFPDDGMTGRLATVSGVVRLDARLEKAGGSPWRVTGRVEMGGTIRDETRQFILQVLRPDVAGGFALSIPL